MRPARCERWFWGGMFGLLICGLAVFWWLACVTGKTAIDPPPTAESGETRKVAAGAGAAVGGDVSLVKVALDYGGKGGPWLAWLVYPLVWRKLAQPYRRRRAKCPVSPSAGQQKN